MNCAKCEPVLINSCSFIIGRAYDVNRRLVFAFRFLGIGLAGIDKFCGIILKPIFQSFYDKIVNVIYTATKTICELSMKNAVEEVKELDNAEKLTVSGNLDETWFLVSFRRYYSHIILFRKSYCDLIVKNSFCKACKFWKNLEGTEEYDEWRNEYSDICSANHEGSAGKIKVDSIIEMFKRSETLYNVRYGNYVVNGDNKTYKRIVDSKPYGNCR